MRPSSQPAHLTGELHVQQVTLSHNIAWEVKGNTPVLTSCLHMHVCGLHTTHIYNTGHMQLKIEQEENQASRRKGQNLGN